MLGILGKVVISNKCETNVTEVFTGFKNYRENDHKIFKKRELGHL